MTGRRIAAVLVVLLVLCGQTCFARSPKVPQEMRELAFLIGTWEGAGSVHASDGQETIFEAILEVEPLFDGAVLMLRLRSSSDPQGADALPVPYVALRVISVDLLSKSYFVRSFTPDGFTVDWESELEEETLTCWVDDVRAGRSRFRLSLAPDGGLRELGDVRSAVSAPGVDSWRPRYELELTKREAKTTEQSN